MTSAAAVLKDIADAFGSADRPSADQITRTTPFEHHLESEGIRSRFGGRDWRELSVELLELEAQSLYFMSAAGVRYYLPAFLWAVIEHYQVAGNIRDVLISFPEIDMSGPDPSLRTLGQRRLAAYAATLALLRETFPQDLQTEEVARSIRALRHMESDQDIRDDGAQG